MPTAGLRPLPVGVGVGVGVGVAPSEPAVAAFGLPAVELAVAAVAAAGGQAVGIAAAPDTGMPGAPGLPGAVASEEFASVAAESPTAELLHYQASAAAVPAVAAS